jgi:hypothetical protein
MRPRPPGAHACGVAPVRMTRDGSLVVEIPCRECGRPIVMVAVDGSTEIADRVAFLRVHRNCLVASVPEQRATPRDR